MINGADSMKYLQQLRELAQNSVAEARSKSKGRLEKESDEEDYRSVFAKIQREQEEWDSRMKELDLAQYKIAAMDSFWTGSSKYQNLAYKYALREQQSQNQHAINSLIYDISNLQRLNFADIANGEVDVKSAVELHKTLNTALQSVVLLSVMNNSALQGNMNGGFFF